MSAATVSRYLAQSGLVTPDPAKRPKSSCLRFAPQLPSECWQSDFTCYPLADGTDSEILTWLDDHSRCALRELRHPRRGRLPDARWASPQAWHAAYVRQTEPDILG